MTHYVCTGDCGGENSKAGVCTSEGCSKENQPLEVCNCEDGIHDDVVRDVAGDELDPDTGDADDEN